MYIASYEHNVILSAQDMQLNIPWYGRGRARRRRMENEFLEPGAHPEYAGYVQGYTNVVPVEPLKVHIVVVVVCVNVYSNICLN